MADWAYTEVGSDPKAEPETLVLKRV
ncbi:hypothetical protein GP2143_01870 [marine gamma proteobacterium HTCC2143]|uniref:Uncharacterized protein n=1 Tax=marine gamma proteobacterium HTCC2143 TaxID=247633 RepID=A0YG01_9GAMM|nr:hypothetical protein GP2143_01870 [marine gamma proteobacterium HTCC2143]